MHDGLQPLQQLGEGGVWLTVFETLAAKSPRSMQLIDSSNAVLEIIVRPGARPAIPSCARRVIRHSIEPAIYRQRNLIERFFCKLKQFRRGATRFDKLARNVLAAVLLASTRLWFRVYESTPEPARMYSDEGRSVALPDRSRRRAGSACPARADASQAGSRAPTRRRSVRC
ncbi:transposase [Inquilinus limosus]